MELKDICQYISEKVATTTLTKENYISTENMLPDKGGIVTASGVPFGNSTAFSVGDVLVSNIRPYFKKIWQANRNGGCSADVLCFRANSNVDNSYFYYLLSQQEFFDYIMSGAKGCKMPRGDKRQIMQWKVELPPLDEQRHIASVLLSLDEKIELNRRINGNLEQQAQALFKAWFVDFEPFKSGKFVDSELGRIPEGWKVGRLDEIGEIVGGGTPSKSKAEYYCDKGIPWVTPKDLSITHAKFTSKGEVDISDLGYKNSSTQILPKGSVLFSSRAPIGYITIALNDICTNQGFKSVIPKIAGTAFIYCYLKNNIKNIESQATGSTFKEASGSLMKSLKVLRPDDISIYRRFEEVETSLFEKQAALEEENLRLSTLRDTLLPQLMSGELKINDLNR